MIRIVITLCQLSAPFNCHELSLATLSMQGCMMGVPAMADFMKDYPQYRLASWKCQIGVRRERA